MFAIIGNCGSGKTTLAKKLSQSAQIPILDLDTIAWTQGSTPVRQPIDVVKIRLQKFCLSQSNWIVEGCYGDLIEIVLKWKPELIFLNPGEAVCLNKCLQVAIASMSELFVIPEKPEISLDKVLDEDWFPESSIS
ncbi:dephospho-CoA kinase [Gloeocapsa sp. PCC 73106]|uniref:dephospho-CoA kinase n=1 Tax=Gloeocapsa sp. PCC 73106 TaxID=102232 RepID=UPI0002ABE07C|nr:dephospho-CoA kinase [Gloeocapsa sp. PCC 73106]ELR97254.1 adenylate kinase-like kinase [Gloeocapsa sp. PCC 73106]